MHHENYISQVFSPHHQQQQNHSQQQQQQQHQHNTAIEVSQDELIHVCTFLRPNELLNMSCSHSKLYHLIMGDHSPTAAYLWRELYKSFTQCSDGDLFKVQQQHESKSLSVLHPDNGMIMMKVDEMQITKDQAEEAEAAESDDDDDESQSEIALYQNMEQTITSCLISDGSCYYSCSCNIHWRQLVKAFMELQMSEEGTPEFIARGGRSLLHRLSRNSFQSVIIPHGENGWSCVYGEKPFDMLSPSIRKQIAWRVVFDEFNYSRTNFYMMSVGMKLMDIPDKIACDEIVIGESYNSFGFSCANLGLFHDGLFHKSHLSKGQWTLPPDEVKIKSGDYLDIRLTITHRDHVRATFKLEFLLRGQVIQFNSKDDILETCKARYVYPAVSAIHDHRFTVKRLY